MHAPIFSRIEKSEILLTLGLKLFEWENCTELSSDYRMQQTEVEKNLNFQIRVNYLYSSSVTAVTSYRPHKVIEQSVAFLGTKLRSSGIRHTIQVHILVQYMKDVNPLIGRKHQVR